MGALSAVLNDIYAIRAGRALSSLGFDLQQFDPIVFDSFRSAAEMHRDIGDSPRMAALYFILSYTRHLLGRKPPPEFLGLWVLCATASAQQVVRWAQQGKIPRGTADQFTAELLALLA